MGPKFIPEEEASAFRRIAASVWSAPNDPTIHGSMDIDVTEALSYIQALRKLENTKVTITHLVARALALGLAKHPDFNARVRFWGKIERRTTVDLSLQVAAEGGKDLSSARIERANELSVSGIAKALQQAAHKIRTGTDDSYGQSRTMFKKMPWWLIRPALRASSALMNDLNVHLPKMGLPADPFGSAMVTNVGVFGIDTAFAPFTPFARCPILLLVPEVRDRPWVHNGEVVPRPVLRLCATFDHRIIDGFHAGVLAKEVGDYLKAPHSFDPLPKSESVDSVQAENEVVVTAR